MQIEETHGESHRGKKKDKKREFTKSIVAL
jgi:hypothetical protein